MKSGLYAKLLRSCRMLRFIVFLLPVWLILGTGQGAVPGLYAGERPNVVLILTDDQGWWDMGAHGNPVIQTPNMDRLAAEGVEFTRFYASPVCTPTRAALLTGRHYQRTGAVDTYMGRDTLSSEEVTLGEVFQRAGYRTGVFGKWHLGRYMKYHPNQRGFQEFFGFWQYGFIHHYQDPDELFHNGNPVAASGYITDILTDRAIDFLQAPGERPFFLYLPYNAPHSPYLVPDEEIEPYLAAGRPLREARIYGMITRIDKNLGRLLQAIDDADLREKTVVIFMSDNGGVSRHFKAGLRGQKGTVYEGGVRVPFVLRWPGKFTAGAKTGAMAQHIDIFPTLCELIGAPLPEGPDPYGKKIDGKSLLGLLQNPEGESPHDYLFHQWNRVRPLLDAPDSPLPPAYGPGDRRRFRPQWAVQDRRGFKLVHSPQPEDSSPEWELFDLRNDPAEAVNLAAQLPEKVRELGAAFRKWFTEVNSVGDDIPVPIPVPIEVGREDENPVELDVTWGRTQGEGGKVQPSYHGYNRDSVDNWSEKEDSVRWAIEVMKKGTYEVTLSYGCSREDAGSKFLVTVGKARLRGVVEATAGSRVFATRRLGTLRLAPGPAFLEIKPVTLAGRELMNLHKIWLRRLP
ncbi:MAG: arylsulfatase [Acidobacteria bacterium]|nr:arylsulfatase [Acidobacteriota bacterium]